MQIQESGMLFGDFKPEKIFRIENSQLHNHIGSGIKSVEFILLRGTNKIFLIEAKSSSPRSDKRGERYQEFLCEITEKFVHSFHMFSACHIGRLCDEGEMGGDLKTLVFAKAKFVFVLVIRGHKKEWLLPLQEELNHRLHYLNSIWASRIIVMNDEIARENHFIV